MWPSWAGRKGAPRRLLEQRRHLKQAAEACQQRCSWLMAPESQVMSLAQCSQVSPKVWSKQRRQ